MPTPRSWPKRSRTWCAHLLAVPVVAVATVLRLGSCHLSSTSAPSIESWSAQLGAHYASEKREAATTNEQAATTAKASMPVMQKRRGSISRPEQPSVHQSPGQHSRTLKPSVPESIFRNPPTKTRWLPRQPLYISSSLRGATPGATIVMVPTQSPMGELWGPCKPHRIDLGI